MRSRASIPRATLAIGGLALARELNHGRRQRHRQIIDAIEAEILEHAHRGNPAGPGYAGNDDQARLVMRLS